MKIQISSLVIALILVLVGSTGCNNQKTVEKPTEIEETESLDQTKSISDKQIEEILSSEKKIFEATDLYIKGDTSIRPGSRVINGRPAYPSEIPWQVGLTIRGVEPDYGFFCGGSVIGAKWILTAAHCLEGVRSDALDVYSGSVKLSSGGTVHHVSRVIIHPDYDPENFDNDIALLELETPFVYNQNLKKIGFPSKSIAQGLLSSGSKLTVSGWGKTESGNLSDHLMRADIDFVTEQRCRRSYGNFITQSMFCAGSVGIDACQGDSGGPLFLRDDAGQPYIVGVVSWGIGCAEPQYYGVYTNVGEFHDWIVSEGVLTSTTNPS